MTVHTACIGPEHATNVHTNCPGYVRLLSGEVRVCSCSVCGHESASFGLNQRDSGVETWENKGGPEGALTPVVPALDQHTSQEGSASRG